jgi:hypothetical protein
LGRLTAPDFPGIGASCRWKCVFKEAPRRLITQNRCASYFGNCRFLVFRSHQPALSAIFAGQDISSIRNFFDLPFQAEARNYLLRKLAPLGLISVSRKSKCHLIGVEPNIQRAEPWSIPAFDRDTYHRTTTFLPGADLTDVLKIAFYLVTVFREFHVSR